jgi:hypothetical protein
VRRLKQKRGKTRGSEEEKSRGLEGKRRAED